VSEIWLLPSRTPAQIPCRSCGTLRSFDPALKKSRSKDRSLVLLDSSYKKAFKTRAVPRRIDFLIIWSGFCNWLFAVGAETFKVNLSVSFALSTQLFASPERASARLEIPSR
jgi:hypothetical protein